MLLFLNHLIEKSGNIDMTYFNGTDRGRGYSEGIWLL